uniref:Large ribosomal subunit protein bL33c n=1 Tax=Mesotaenium endlicherianum TaxID=184485 RepID=A0A024B3Q5_9VIRI|nr:ribosomal protein L33 [Mesotaenium endlicherianum]AHZ11164.1 ribosomal protein L33 [Mesotaenium endlicherianum]
MAKNKDVRVTITLECTFCPQNEQKRLPGVSRYITQKNRRNTPNRLELKKFCLYCGRHTVHREIKR